MSGRCETCKWWSSKTKASGLCTKMTATGGDVNDDSTLAYADTGNDATAFVMTDPSFGCVMWEAK